MPASAVPPDTVQAFIKRWETSGAAERANYQLFLTELCDILGVPRPEPTRPEDEHNAYVFERAVTFHHGDGTTSTGRIDLYKRACFVLEAKQGRDQAEAEPFALSPKPRKQRRGTALRGTQGWDDAMLAARGQAEQYAKALPAAEGWPPFLLVVDVGHSIELFADFSGIGKTYTHFPDVRSYRIGLRDLGQETMRDRLRQMWTEPLALDPSRRSAKVTREVAAQLAELAKSLEASGHAAETVATFLMRCIFTMFAEDVDLLPKESFTRMLKSLKGECRNFAPMAEELWTEMKTGKAFSAIVRAQVLKFNGGLFESAAALPVTEKQLALLTEAAEKEWSQVEPAIFGTLLERALDPRERHKLGAHFTPRAYVERLVIPTVIEPLRKEWEAVKVAAVTLAKQGQRKDAIAELQVFHHRLCEIKVLDPACGSGNFLYVTLEHLKRLEGEINDLAVSFGEEQGVFENMGYTVDPHQLLGIEVNPRAAAITDLVLWIGYLQWHFRTHGSTMPAQPVLKSFHNIESRDAVLAYDRKEPVLDDKGHPVTRWDGHTMKKHPVTDEDVPDEKARSPVFRYINARKAEWPKANYVVGNPPFIGNKRMRAALGDGYVEALREAWPAVPGAVDYVMYWWDYAADRTSSGDLFQFGFITTNSITQTYSGQVVQSHLSAPNSVSLVLAVPDHPWVDTELGADVRVSMTVARSGAHKGMLLTLVFEGSASDEGTIVCFTETHGPVNSNLQIGANTRDVVILRANEDLCWQGCKLVGEHFQITPELRDRFIQQIPEAETRLPSYWAGSDVTKRRTPRFVIDLFGLSAEEATKTFPPLMQHIMDYVKPERDQNRDRTFREKWWIFGRPRPDLRSAVSGLHRYIVTSEVAKHRTFMFLSWPENLIDGSITAITMSDAFYLGIVSSRIHVVWALAAGGRMGVGNDPRYQNGPCFDPFPFPDCHLQQKSHIRQLGERLDLHRKRQQALNPNLTLTDMYNVLEKLHSGATLNEKEKLIHEQGLVSVLKQIHDDLNKAVFNAYGWPADLIDEQILERLVALNAVRAAEEERGLIRWLRPEFQNPQGAATAAQGKLELSAETEAPAPAKPKLKALWPKSLAEQAQAVRAALACHTGPVTAAHLAASFNRARADRIEELLETLATLGQAREVSDGKYVG